MRVEEVITLTRSQLRKLEADMARLVNEMKEGEAWPTDAYDLDLTNLRKIAEDARDAFERQDFLDMIETGNTRRRALDPTTVLALIDEIERREGGV